MVDTGSKKKTHCSFFELEQRRETRRWTSFVEKVVLLKEQ